MYSRPGQWESEGTVAAFSHGEQVLADAALAASEVSTDRDVMAVVVVSSQEVLDVDVWHAHVVALTSNLDRAGLAGTVLLDAAVTGLPKDSVAVPPGSELVDRSWLGDRVGRLPGALVHAVDDGVRAVLGL